jgi:hypothetical protein
LVVLRKITTAFVMFRRLILLKKERAEGRIEQCGRLHRREGSAKRSGSV